MPSNHVSLSVYNQQTWRDIGSALTVVLLFLKDGVKILVGFSDKDKVWKNPCGKIEQQDFPHQLGQYHDEEFAVKAALNCARREFEAETGFKPSVLQSYVQIPGVRKWPKRIKGEQITLSQFTFFALMGEEIKIPITAEERAEMPLWQYRDVCDVLVNAHLKKGACDKFNPYHGIAIARTLLHLMKEYQLHEMKEFEIFRSLLRRLEEKHINLFFYEEETMRKMREDGI